VQAVFGPSTVRLTARVSGRGRVVGRGIACPPSCSAAVNVDGPLTLAVEPARGWRFAGWTGACRGTKLCRIVPQAAVAVRARFVRR
jgi:hypothetical protein